MRRLVKLLVVLLVVAVLAVLADRGVDVYAERRAASALTETLGTTPDVAIDGFPFLTQWADGRFERVTVRADRVTAGGTRVQDLTMSAEDVRTPAYARTARDVRASTAGSVRLVGLVPYGSLPLPAGITAKRQGDEGDRLRLSGSTEVLDRKVRFRAVVRVSLTEDGDVRLQPRDVDVLGDLPSAAVTGLVRDHLEIQVSPPGLPPRMQVSSLQVTDTGLRLDATGKNVRLPSQ